MVIKATAPSRIEPEVALRPALGRRPETLQDHRRELGRAIVPAEAGVPFKRVTDPTEFRPHLREVRHVCLCPADAYMRRGCVALQLRQLGLGLRD